MKKELELKDPWLVAVWPGIGHVAVSAGYYLMAKMGMHMFAEFSARELFDDDFVEVKDGLIHAGRLPRSRLYLWKDPNGRHDIVLFIGEAQPPIGKYAFCKRLLDYVRKLGVRRVFTFAAMATGMRPEDDTRVVGAATDLQGLEELKRLELEIVEDGRISGLNGVLLAAAAETDIHGICLLGEMPGVFVQLPFPKASLVVLQVFCTMASIDLDLTELAEQAVTMEQRLEELLNQVEDAIEERTQPGDEEEEEHPAFEPPEPHGLAPEEYERIENLFRRAEEDRSKAYELKKELDRLEVFSEYEDRFLDLFTRPQ